MPGKTRKRGGGGRATGGPGAASSRWRGSWPADAPSLKRALGGPSGRIFLNAAREIAGILEELVQREAEREQPFAEAQLPFRDLDPALDWHS
jgi:hypothetical protein